MIRLLRAFGAFWYGFIVGDDWRVAAGVLVALGVTAVATHLPGAPAWVVLALAVTVLLAVSVRRAIRGSDGGRAAPR